MYKMEFFTPRKLINPQNKTWVRFFFTNPLFLHWSLPLFENNLKWMVYKYCNFSIEPTFNYQHFRGGFQKIRDDPSTMLLLAPKSSEGFSTTIIFCFEIVTSSSDTHLPQWDVTISKASRNSDFCMIPTHPFDRCH